MVKRHAARLAVAFTGAIGLLVAVPTAAVAGPTNDDFTAAVVVKSLPYSTTLDTTDATSDPSDPTDCSNERSVWYSYTPATNMTIQAADTFGRGYHSVLSAWSGEQGSLRLLACSTYYGGTQSKIIFSATAGTTYHFMVARHDGSGDAELQLSISEIQAPVNDNFANALTVNSLPYSNTQDYGTASPEIGEPPGCYNHYNRTGTVWYSYTPTTTQSISASSSPAFAGIGVYTGNSLDRLSQVTCRSVLSYGPLTFVAQAGTTYLFQVSPEQPEPYTFQLEFIAQSGVDLGLVVPDVKTRIDWKRYDEVDGSEPALRPGDATTVFAYIANQGDMIADGVDLKITLPKGVVFGADLKECAYTADRRTADCRGGLIQLKPGEDLLGVFPVKVAADVKAPVSLTGGVAEVSSRGALPVGAKSLAPGGAQLPSFLREAAAIDVPKGADIDDSDNSDSFAVIVAAKAADGGTGGGGGDDDGGLPVTGPQAGLIGSVGLAAAVAGGALYLAARRRRVVLVMPGDEKPTT